ncbi:MAG: FAD-dependent oxidoreductase [Acidimicrobiales bacterium]|jgi:glycine/D-amino acid oxidase-like deaminating enzyme
MRPPRSLWWSTLDEPVEARASLSSDIDADVAVVGAGYTGLWTARELKRRDPHLRIVMLEKSLCGFGASGRNGGWASALYPLGEHVVLERHGADAAEHLRLMLQRAVDDLGDSVREDRIDAHFVKGGSLTFARNPVQASRLHDEITRARDRGLGDQDLRWLDEHELYEYGYVAGALGATYSPHCARLHPARLARGLGDVVERLGVTIYEDTAVTRIIPASRSRRARVITVGGTVRADVVVRATEGFTPTLPGERRTVAPIYSLMIATEPQSPAFWHDAGFRHYPTFADDRHAIIYGQRTADDRIAFGGRGAPYHFGSSVEERFDEDAKTFRALEHTLRELFPTFNSAISHRWGGPLALPRDREPSVVFDPESGLAAAGGYTGDGVVLSRVCAIALADLITNPGSVTDHTNLAFVHHQSRKWEYEPLRWMGINAGRSFATRADAVEHTGRQSRASDLLGRLLGE